MKNIAIIGGGASGIVSAIFAARNGARVTLFEGGERIGKKLLMTGNGKCNFSNESIGDCDKNHLMDYYSGSMADLLPEIFSDFGLSEALDFFKELGLEITVRKGGLYPYSESAASMLDVLRFELSRLGVRVITDRKVEDLRPIMKRFSECILTPGGAAAPKTGSDGNMYGLLKRMGVKIVDPLPSLTFLKSREDFLKRVRGIRCKAGLRLFIDDKFAGESNGELQFIDQGLSGICVFDLSGAAAKALQMGQKVKLQVNFFPEIQNREAGLRFLMDRKIANPDWEIEKYFIGILNRVLGEMILKQAGIHFGKKVSSVSEEEVSRILDSLISFPVSICGTGDFSRAQVTRGGIPLEEVTEGLELRKLPGVFAAGEILDIDGICGGFNLQWAWSSAYRAAMAAVGRGL
ncbi:MAG: aminoacetone oxidase family FAD-binding enzyme [Lachnospiraceae bacterium]|nr:aminoacetone oxidase family FAD-binding enzyme [Lachnospiraceae bacterium]